MKALIFRETGEPNSVLKLAEIPTPALAPGEALVRVLLSPINASDLHMVRGRYGYQPELPASPGIEGVGIVEAVGPDVQDPIVGTRVVFVGTWHTWREQIVCPVDRLVPVPVGLDDQAAATSYINPLTAWALTRSGHNLKEGDWLLQTAAASSVGKLVLQLSQQYRFKTINVIRRREQETIIRNLGGNEVICTADEDLSAYHDIQAKHDLQEENIVLREEIDRTSMFEEIVGVSAPIRSALFALSKVAPTDATVLITGETGTGKELFARAIHKRSQRSNRPFVAVNCAAIPSSLIASELFGHEKGAFTGATERRQGRFESAEGGTIFLDEVGEVPAEIQVALLRVLQEREFERVGGSRAMRANVRVIAATNRNLEAAIENTTLRSDLYYRLNVFPLHVPPLRERDNDIRLLVEYFAFRFAKRAGKKIKRIGAKTLTLLQSYGWPGNVRELQNVVERAVILSESDELCVDERWLPRMHTSSMSWQCLHPARWQPTRKKSLKRL